MRAPLFALTTSLLAALALGSASCKSAYYSTMEKFGVEKRDILVDRVEDAREDQAEAKEQFQTTFEAFQQLTGFDGGELEAKYKKLSKELKRSEDAASSVSSRISSIESVATDLFSEWSSEIGQISDANMRRSSETLLRDTQASYDKLVTSMRKAESKMDPVLQKFRDQVLFLKHNLNAQAIGSLQGDLGSIEAEVERLIQEMQASIDEADSFIASMST